MVLGGYRSPVLLRVSFINTQSHLSRTSLEQVWDRMSSGHISFGFLLLWSTYHSFRFLMAHLLDFLVFFGTFGLDMAVSWSSETVLNRPFRDSESLHFFDRTGLGSSFSFSLDMAEVKRVYVEWTVLHMRTKNTLVNRPFRNLYRQSSDSEVFVFLMELNSVFFFTRHSWLNSETCA